MHFGVISIGITSTINMVAHLRMLAGPASGFQLELESRQVAVAAWLNYDKEGNLVREIQFA